MPKYAIKPELFDGAVLFDYLPCRGIDANGQDIGPGIYVDTDEGLVISALQEDGRNVIRDGGVVMKVERFAPPIVLVRFK